MKANSTPTTVTWDSELSLDDRASINLAVRCTYDIESLCLAMLEKVREEFANDEAPLVAMVRMNATRIMKLNSVLMSQLDEDGVTLKTAYTTLYGVKPAEGEHAMTAAIVALPTAAAVAPVQPARRGRYPKCVVPLWRLRNQRTSRLIEEQQREEKIKIARQGIQMFEDLARERRGDLAQLMARE